jgi:hypothetical protein
MGLYAKLALAVFVTLTGSQATLALQRSASAPTTSVSIEPSELVLGTGEKSRIKVTVRDRTGNTVDYPVRFVASNSWALSVTPEGDVTGLRPGSYHVTAVVTPPGVAGSGPIGASSPDPLRRLITAQASIVVKPPQVTNVTITAPAGPVYAGSTTRLDVAATDAAGAIRTDEEVRWSSSDASVATVNRRGEVTALKAGAVTVVATVGSTRGERRLTIVASPIAHIALTVNAEQVRTGDVVHVTAVAHDAARRVVPATTFRFALSSTVADTVPGGAAPAEVDAKGRFVAELPGEYTVFAIAGGQIAQKNISVSGRDVGRNIKILGRGQVTNVQSSDIWICEGADGRDYAVTGSHADGGITYFWDITDSANPVKTDSVVIDARTVNDVKMDEGCTVAVLTREGASNRRNGLVIVDIRNPRDVNVLANYDEGLTGGVHNVYVYKKHIYALSGGRRYDIINIEDPSKPRKVSQFELDTPGHGIHDVWVHDGIAYSSQWQDGVILVDVGNGVAGGSPEKPVQFAQYKYKSTGGVHTALPFKSKTGKFYVLAGDGMIWPYGISLEEPSEPGGFIHVIDFTDVKNPEEVARYQIPDAGPHNYWIENEILYIAHYNAGVRVVDVSGELKGDLLRQGREMAKFKPFDKDGVVPNSPMTWGVMPWKGNFFFSDMNSGLWSAQLEPKRPMIP